jgi:hypothetical protein
MKSHGRATTFLRRTRYRAACCGARAERELVSDAA